MGKYRSPFKAAAKQTLAFKVKGSWAAGYHTGEDWVCNNTALVSPCSGTVLRNEWDDSYGNFVVIRAEDNKVILMAHMKSKSALKVGAGVKAGDAVGTMGSTGNSTGAHLHIEVQNAKTWGYNKNLLKPSDYIDFSDTTNINAQEEAFMAKTYKNGSTTEKVYQTTADCKAGKDAVGSLNTYETCECVGIYDGCYAVVYTLDGTSSKKIGFVKYSGGVK